MTRPKDSSGMRPLEGQLDIVEELEKQWVK